MKNQPLLLTMLFFSSFTLLRAQITGHVNYEQAGIEFNIPNGWFGQEAEGMLVLGSYQKAGRIVLLQHQYNKTQLIQEAKKPMVDNYGTNMSLQGNLAELSSTAVGGLFTGTMEYQPAKAYIIGIANPHGGYGATIIAATTADLYDASYEILAKEIYQSFQFKKITQPSTTTTTARSNQNATGELKEWIDWFNDTRLVYLYYYGSGGSGDSDEIRIDLCAKGYFNYMRNGYTIISTESASASQSGNSSGSGSWQVQEASPGNFVLILNFNDGSLKQYDLRWEDDKLYLNGNRYFRTKTGDEAPNCR